MGLAQNLQRAIQALAVECDDTYAMAYRVEDMLEEIFDDHEAQLKEANRIKEAFRNLSLELNIEASELRAQMKAKDEEIERLKEFEEMVEWMELNSNRSLCDYYNNKDNK